MIARGAKYTICSFRHVNKVVRLRLGYNSVCSPCSRSPGSMTGFARPRENRVEGHTRMLIDHASTDLTSLSGRVALVTGCGSGQGIGFAAARTVAARGAEVMITSTTDRIH